MRKRDILPLFIVNWIRKYQKFKLEEDDAHDPKAGIRDKIWLWRTGFYSLHKRMFGLTEENYRDYLPNRAYSNIHPINGCYSKLIDNKGYLPLITDHTTKLYIVIDSGIERFRKGIGKGSLEEVLTEFMENNSLTELVCKPLSDTGGSGVRMIKQGDIEQVLSNLVSNKASFVLQERISQLEYATKIYPKTLNTIRVMLFRDVKSRRINVLGTYHRFGTSDSGNVDNCMQGGIMAPIHHNTGELGRAFARQISKKHYGWHSIHPDTKAAIEGVVIPDWTNRIESIINVFENLSWFEYGGIDVVLKEDGFIIIEINSLPGIDIPQLNQPLLRNAEFKEFLISKGLNLN